MPGVGLCREQRIDITGRDAAPIRVEELTASVAP